MLNLSNGVPVQVLPYFTEQKKCIQLTPNMSSSWVGFLPEFIRARVEGRPYLRRVIDNTAWLFADNLLRMAAGLFVGVWVARYLGPEQFGQYNYALAFVAIFSVVGTLGLDANVVRDLVNEAKVKDEILGTATCLRFLGGGFAAALSIAIIVLLKPDSLVRWLVVILAFGMLFQAFETIAQWFQAQIQSKHVVVAKNLVVATMTLAKVLLILGGASLVAFAWVGLTEAILTMFALVIAYEMSGEHVRAWMIQLGRAKKLFADSWPLLISSLTAMLYLKIDIVMLGEMHSETAVGVYAAATRISEVWYFIPMALMSSLQPSIIQAKQHSEDLFQSRLRNIYGLMSAISICVAFGVTFFADELVRLLFGQFYEAAGIVLAVHVWAAIAVFLGVASSQYLIIENLQKIAMYRTTIGLLCNIVLNVILIPRYGAVGAAVATLFSYSLAILSMYFFAQSRVQAKMILASLNPLGWRSLLREA